MLAKPLNALVVALAFGTLNLAAQQTAQPATPGPQPLKAMPYSPSLFLLKPGK